MTETEQETSLCEYLPWDSEFFGVRIGRVAAAGPYIERVFLEAERWCDTNRVDCLYLVSDSNDVDGIILAEEHGFRLVDVRVHYECRIFQNRPKPESAAVVRPLRDSDVPALLEIAGRSHRNTRFHADSHFSRARCDALYQTWVQKSCAGWADHVVVAELDGVPCGYMTVHLDGPGQGRLALLAVAEDARNRGVGSLIVYHSLEWLAGRQVTRATWPTQVRNVSAQRLCSRWGFELCSVDIWHHRWRR